MASTARGAETGATRAFARRVASLGTDPAHHRDLDGLTVSSIGIGTYLGPPDDATDAAYTEAVVRAVELGTNLIDTAVNYRFQRSERAVGEALRRLENAGTATRAEVVLATKGGFFPFDGARPEDPARWAQRNVVERGLAAADEIAAGCHCMAPLYLRDQIERSRANLGVETLDLYYVHNPETQLGSVDRATFRARLAAAFGELERAADEGHIRAYGLATWDGFRVEMDHRSWLSIAEAVAVAAEVGGPTHRFRVVELPLSLAMPEALTRRNQPVPGVGVHEPVPGGDADADSDGGASAPLTLLEAAERLGVAVVASASLLQARLAKGLPPRVGATLPGLETDAQRALQAVRSAPGVRVALVGMTSVAHVEENLVLARVPPAPGASVHPLFMGR